MDWVGKSVGDGGRYAVERPLGEGAMGQVFLGRDARLNRRVVLKVLSPALAQNPKIRQRFANEGEIQANLLHDHIVRVVDAFDAEETSVIVMDFVDGPTVEDHLEQVGGRLSYVRAHAIMAPVCDAVGYAHAHGVIHRDLKPANILLDLGRGFEVPKVADFGIAKIASDASDASDAATRTRAGAVMGTPAFMPAEQLRGAVDLDHRADIYALGVVLYQLTTGQLPYGDATEYEVTHKVLLGEPIGTPSEFAPDLPDGFDAVVAKATAYERDARYQAVAELRADLDRLLAAAGAAIVLEPAASVRSTPALAPPAPVETASVQTLEAPAKPKPSGRSWLPWIGLGGALVAGAVIALVLGGGAAEDAAQTPGEPAAPVPAATLMPAARSVEGTATAEPSASGASEPVAPVVKPPSPASASVVAPSEPEPELEPAPEPEPPPEPEVVAPSAPSYPTSSLQPLVKLPVASLPKGLRGTVQALGISTWAQLWSRTPVQLAGTKRLNGRDTRPWMSRYTADDATFFVRDGRVYQVLLALGRDKVGFAAALAAVLGRVADRAAAPSASAVENVWFDGDLVVVIRRDKKKSLVTIADRAAWERAEADYAKVAEGQRLISESVNHLRGAGADLHLVIRLNEQALAVNDRFGHAWVNICHMRYDLGQLDLAREACRKTLEVTIDETARGEALYYQALLALAAGDRTEALRLLEEAKPLIPSGWRNGKDVSSRLAVLRGRGSKGHFKTAVNRLGCMQGRGLGRRAEFIPSEYGYRSAYALESAASAAGVDVPAVMAKAAKKCRAR